MWSDVLDKLRGLRRMTWTLVSEYAQVFDVSDGRLLLLFDSPGRASSFGRGSHAEYVRQALIDVIGLDVRVEAVSGEVSRSPASAAPVVTRPAAARPNPGPANPGPANPGPANPGPANPGPAGQAAAPGPPPVPPAGPPLEEPPGWGPPSAVPGGSATGSVRGAPDQPASRPEQRPEPPPDTRPAAPGALREEPRRDGLPARPMAERPGSTGSAGGAGRFAGRRPPAPPRDDVPLPDEPPAEEPPPEDDFDPYAQPVGRLSTERPVRAVPRPAVTDPSPQSPAAPAAGASGRGTSSAANEISLAAGPVPPSRYAALRAAVPTAQRTALRRPEVQVVVTGDEPSADDPDVEDSGLVGPPVVAQLLGGRVIEERTE
jgi:DNA polymerase-3 subunit gamma/tau